MIKTSIIFGLLLLVFVCPNLVNAQLSQSQNTDGMAQQKIPNWVRNNAKWWAGGSISDGEFIKGIQYLIQQGLIVVPSTQPSFEHSQAIPSWIKNSAKWWSEGTTSDTDFIKGIQYLVQNGIIQVSTPAGTTTNSDTQSPQLNTFHNYGFSFNYPKGWTVEDETTNKTMPFVKIHSNDSSTVVNMGLISNEMAFTGLTGQAYLDTLIEYYKSECSSNPNCSDFNLTFSKIVPSASGSMYLINFNSVKIDGQGNKVMHTLSDIDIPTQTGTWIIEAEGPSSNYASYNGQVEKMIASLNFDKT